MEGFELKLYVKPLMEIIPMTKSAAVVTSCEGTDCVLYCESDEVCRNDGCDSFECGFYDCGDDGVCSQHCPGVG